MPAGNRLTICDDRKVDLWKPRRVEPRLRRYLGPANSDGTLNEAWEGANIRKIAPPDGWHFFYQADTGLVPVSGIRMHRVLEEVFVAVLDDVWNFAKKQVGDGASDDAIRAWLHTRRLDQHAGFSCLRNCDRLGCRTQS